ncbi:MAG: mechanosensitive ion channel family protein [Sphingobacteriales bacterium]|nr:MAG: mechanosensitive ion channel family protein [Sphingobacteriales bacterium]
MIFNSVFFLINISVNEIQRSFEHYWQHLLDILPKVILAIIVVVVGVFIATQVSRIVSNKLSSKSKDPLLIPLITRVTKWVLVLGGIMFAMQVLGLNNIAASIIAGAGISAFVIGFALKDIGENFLAGVILAFNRPFHIGDTISIDDHTGDVKALSIRTTHIRTFDGNDVYIPNSYLIKNTLINITSTGLTRVNFSIGIDYYDDIDKAFDVIIAAIKSIEGVLEEKPPFANVDSFETNCIKLKVYFWYNSITYKPGIFHLQSHVMKATVEALLNNGFDIPGNIHEHKLYRKLDKFPVEIHGETKENQPQNNKPLN